MDISDIKCKICNNISNEFFLCNTCNNIFCPLCKPYHEKNEKNHIIINYEDRNYICKKHNNYYIKYCSICKKDICFNCQNEHIGHCTIDYSNILTDKNELKNKINELKKTIDLYKYKTNIIKEIFDRMTEVLKLYYQINIDIVNNYNTKKINYYILQNINNLKINTENVINELNQVFNYLGEIINYKGSVSDNYIYHYDINSIYNYSKNNFYNSKINGEKYIGDIKNNLKDGKGILFYNNNNLFPENRKIYEGEFKNNKREGSGTMYWKDGYKFSANF